MKLKRKSSRVRLRAVRPIDVRVRLRRETVPRGAAGKPKMQAVGACMRKLVMIAYGVLKNRAPFDSNGDHNSEL